MLRRTFFARMAQGLAAAALAAHLELGSLVPVVEAAKYKEKWWYLIEITDHAGRPRAGSTIYRIATKRLVWAEEAVLPQYGLKPEDFETLPDDHRVTAINNWVSYPRHETFDVAKPVAILQDDHYPMELWESELEK